MSMTRVPVRKIREVLRLRFDCNLNHSQIAQSCNISRTAVGDYLRRHGAARLGWPLSNGMDNDAVLEAALFPGHTVPGARDGNAPDWPRIHRELSKKGVTLQLLWQEYKAEHPSGYQYSHFSGLYVQWKKCVDLVFRNQHAPGEKLFVDYAGQRVAIYDRLSGEKRYAEIFVAVLGASNYTYAEATWTQQKSDWISSHVNALTFFGGCPELYVPDNLKSGVTTPCRFDPEINATYYAFARHYGGAVMPARPKRPRDKAKAETGVLVVERWILAALRKRKFFSLAELNTAIAELLERLNNRPFKKLEGTRRTHFESFERMYLLPLAARPFEMYEVKKARVHIDYHVELFKRYYSVPYKYVQREVEVHYTQSLVEVYCRGEKIASHAQNTGRVGSYSTQREHMPPSHQEYTKWTPERLINWAQESGASTAEVANQIMLSKPHPQLGFKAVLGLISLGRSYGSERLERACARALAIKSASYRTVKSTLQNGLDAQPLPAAAVTTSVSVHENIRGPTYYQ